MGERANAGANGMFPGSMRCHGGAHADQLVAQGRKIALIAAPLAAVRM